MNNGLSYFMTVAIGLGLAYLVVSPIVDEVSASMMHSASCIEQPSKEKCMSR